MQPRLLFYSKQHGSEGGFSMRRFCEARRGEGMLAAKGEKNEEISSASTASLQNGLLPVYAFKHFSELYQNLPTSFSMATRSMFLLQTRLS